MIAGVRKLTFASFACLVFAEGCTSGKPVSLARLQSGLSDTSPNVVIRQVYGGGGTNTGTYRSDFVELFNAGTTSTLLDGITVVYTSATDAGTFWGYSPQYVSLPYGVTLGPGQSYLISGESSAAGQGTPLPTPDLQTNFQIGEAAGRVMLVYGAGDDASYMQILGYGAANFYSGSPAPAPSPTTAVICGSNSYLCVENSGQGYFVATPTPHNMSMWPNLSSGALCVTRGAVAPTVSSGWVSTTYAQSRGVLGGTGVGAGLQLAQSTVEFQVTSLSNSIEHGTSQRVCAELAAASNCTTVLACWNTDGSFSLEGDTTELCDAADPPDHLPTLIQTAPASLPPLAVGSSTYKMSIGLSRDGQINTNFFRDGVQFPSISVAGPVATKGFSGFRADRASVNVRLTGTTPTGSSITPGQVVSEGSAQTGGGTLSCSFDLEPPPSVAVTAFSGHGFNDDIRQISLSVAQPSANSNGVYHLFLDGRDYASVQSSAPFVTLAVPHSLVNQAYQASVAYEDAGGKLSEPTTLLPSTSLGPVATGDGALTLAVGLFRYADSPGPVEAFSAAALRQKLFDATPGAYTLRNYMLDVSRGQVDVSGTVFEGWHTLVHLDGPNQGTPMTLTDAAACAPFDQGCALGLSGPGDAMTLQAASAGMTVNNVDRALYFVNGVPSADSSFVIAAVGPSAQDPDGLPALSTLVHELGHTLTLAHTYAVVCPGPNLFALDPDSGGDCSNPAGSHATTGSPFIFDAQISSAFHMSRWHSMNQYDMGLLTESEVARQLEFDPNRTYTVRSLGLNASTSPIRQVRVELEPGAFYAIEYRKNEGFDAPGPYDGVVRNGAVTSMYEDPTGVSVLIHPLRAESNSYTNDAVASRMMAGDSYCDPYRGVAIRVLSTNANEAIVSVEHGPCAPCSRGSDCASAVCQAGVCGVASCSDGVQNGGESDIDCGGPNCGPCQELQRCHVNTDCVARDCFMGAFCLTPS